MIRAVPWFLAASSCSGPGILWGPVGRTELRTAMYAIGVRDGQPEMTILLSNGVLGCAGPVRGEPGVAQALEAEATALCREGAQHVVLSVLDPDGAWDGEFPGLRREGTAARRASGTYFGVEEAVLVEVAGLERTYLAFEDHTLDDLGPGTVWLEPGAATGDACDDGVGRVRGGLSFPEVGLSGRFVARPCPCTDASTLRVLAQCLTLRCQRVADGTGCG